MSDWATQFVQAYRQHTPYASASQDQPNLSTQQAYALQQACVAELDLTVAGYKAALTAPAAQAAMNADQPIIGVLHQQGAFAAGDTHSLPRPCLLETEFGFVLAESVSAPITPQNVFHNVASCHPMLEIASPNLAGKPSGLDLIATNAASFGYVMGTKIDINLADENNRLDEMAVALLYEGDTCFSGHGADVMQGQAQALAWLINKVLEVGYPLQAGHLLMTGSIGAMQPAKPGHYEGRFSGLDSVSIRVA